jgi:8-oxo-dGTP pyrophosphatase MutT (NUDIX family)
MPLNLRKVVAYVTRRRNGVVELLVFEHRGIPEAGLQAPAGTVEDGESLADAAVRELYEESGLKGLTPTGPIDVYWWLNPASQNRHHRHVFHFTAADDTPDRWTIRPRGEGEEEQGLVFDFRWIPVADAYILAAEQGRSAYLLARTPTAVESGD